MDFMTIFIKNLKLLLLPNSNNDTCNMCNTQTNTHSTLSTLSLSLKTWVGHPQRVTQSKGLLNNLMNKRS